MTTSKLSLSEIPTQTHEIIGEALRSQKEWRRGGDIHRRVVDSGLQVNSSTIYQTLDSMAGYGWVEVRIAGNRRKEYRAGPSFDLVMERLQRLLEGVKSG